MLVTPNATQNDVVLLSSLERVDACHLNLLVQVLPQGAAELHIADNVRPLALIGSDDSNLARDNARPEEFCDNLLHIGSLRPRITSQRYGRESLEIPNLFKNEVPLEEISS